MKYILLSLIGVFICSQEIAIPYQEKVYLHTDKPFYLVGDTIWLKGYLVNAQTHKESDVQSRFLYIELINRKNKVIQRKKIKEENGRIYISVSNYADMPDFESTEKLPSTKANKNHGYGTEIIRNIVQKYDGDVLFTCKDRKFSTALSIRIKGKDQE